MQLILDILKHDDTLRMGVFEQDELSPTLRHYSQISAGFNEIDKLCLELISILNKTDRNKASQVDSINRLKKTGQLLWDHLFTKMVKEKLKRTNGGNLTLFLDEELISIPWELLHTGEDFLCLKFNLGRVIRTKQQEVTAQYRSFSGTLKMLILANPTNDLKSAYLEGTFIKNQLDRKRREIIIDFKSTDIDTLYVKKNLRDYDIVHFAGHCEYDSDNPGDSGWVLSDGRFTASDIYTLGQTLSQPTLIFSNACHSAAFRDNLAKAFLFSGVRHYIGTIRRVEDTSSLAFAKEFYAQLISGMTMGESLRLSRTKLIKEYGTASTSWVNYLLYGDPNYVLFKARRKPLVTKIKKDISVYKKSLLRLAIAVGIISICIYLYMWLPTLNPNNYLLFLKSHNLFLKGKNQEVIALSQGIIKKDTLFLQVYPQLADTYLRLGDRENALKYYFEYIVFSERKQDKKHLSAAYTGIGWVYLLQGEYLKAFDFYNKAIALSQESKDKLNEARALERLAVWYIDKQDNDKALELLMKSSQINRERLYNRQHKYGLACDYFDIGLVFINKGDFATAREFYNKSRLLFEKLKLKHELSDCYFNLGEISLYEKEYQKALDYYMKGLKIDQQQGNILNIASDYNMIGELYLEMDNLNDAEKYFNQAVSLCKTIDAPVELAGAYYNLGILYKNKGQKNKAREYLRLAQEIYSHIDTPAYQKIKQELLSLSQ